MASTTKPARSWLKGYKPSETLAGYLFISPYLLVTLFFKIGVIAFAVYISLTSFDLFTTPQWLGLENYANALTDEKFLRSLLNVVWYVLIVVPVQTAVALVLASLLNLKLSGSQFFRTIFYSPAVTSSVVISMIFWWLYLKSGFINLLFTNVWTLFGGTWAQIDWLNNSNGLFALILQPIGVKIPSALWYLQGPSVTWMAIMFQNIFTTAPTFMIMFLAALQDVPPTLYEAASIDGASSWQKFWRITLPMLRPVLLLVVVLGTIGAFQIFDQVKILTEGGPLNTTLVPVYLVYTEALGVNGPPHMGYAAAMAFLLAVIIFVFTFIQRRYIEGSAEMY
jgi:multiple sugar transport system permease protein